MVSSEQIDDRYPACHVNLASRGRSFGSISAKQTKSWRSAASGESLAYSTDTEVREMMDEIRSKQDERISVADVAVTYPPFERPPVSPRVRSITSNDTVKVANRAPEAIRIENEQVTLVVDISIIDVGNTAKKFETFVTARVDLALSPLEDRIEMFLVDLDQFQTPTLQYQYHPSPLMDADESKKMNEAPGVEGPDNISTRQSYGLFNGLLESLFHDEPIPIIVPTTASFVGEGSSAATELTEESTRENAENEPIRERKGLPTYTQVMEALLRDESIPNRLGKGIPLNIEISRIE